MAGYQPSSEWWIKFGLWSAKPVSYHDAMRTIFGDPKGAVMRAGWRDEFLTGDFTGMGLPIFSLRNIAARGRGGGWEPESEDVEANDWVILGEWP